MTTKTATTLTNYQIDVTQEDIDKGEQDKCMTCPIARAFGRVAPGAVARVYHGMARLDFGEELQWFELPDAAVEFIEKFDRGEPVEPFSFTLSPLRDSD